MSDQTITSLIEKLEGAEVGSEEIDAAICVLLQYGGPNSEGATNVRTDEDWEGDLIYEIGTEECCCQIPKLSTSLDAALALAERVLPGWGFYLRRDSDGSGCGLVPPGLTSVTPGHMQAATPALALCAALLRAQSEARV